MEVVREQYGGFRRRIQLEVSFVSVCVRGFGAVSDLGGNHAAGRGLSSGLLESVLPNS